MPGLEEKYLTILKEYFGEAFKIAARERYKPEKYFPVLWKLYDPIVTRSMMNSLHDELAALDWASQEDLITRIGGLKAVYTGSGYSIYEHVSSTSDFLRKTCLYTDTVILSEEILKTMSSGPEDEDVPPCIWTGVFESAIQFLAIEHLFTSNSKPHICTLAPPVNWQLKKRKLDSLSPQLLEREQIAFASEFFGKEFDSMEKLREFVFKIEDFKQFFALARKPEMFVMPTGEPSSQEEFDTIKYHFSEVAGPNYIPGSFFLHLLKVEGFQLADDLLANGTYRAVLSTDLKGIWNRLLWIFRKDGEQVLNFQEKKQFTKEELIISSLQQEDLTWLGNVPLNKLEELRERGELEELRAIIGKNVEIVENASDADFVEVGKNVKYNIETALRNHASQVHDLNEKYRRRYKIDATLIAVSGTLGFVCAAFPPMATVSAIIGGVSVSDLAREYAKKRESDQELMRKPVAMLFDARKVCG